MLNGDPSAVAQGAGATASTGARFGIRMASRADLIEYRARQRIAHGVLPAPHQVAKQRLRSQESGFRNLILAGCYVRQGSTPPASKA